MKGGTRLCQLNSCVKVAVQTSLRGCHLGSAPDTRSETRQHFRQLPGRGIGLLL
jgi:hypothetical protein